ncbi:ABC-F family ATP-binding cassette domain-containing protein [Candidatus Dependentiae bacterium]|nr:ABC-F family ATP-binding cassette domain-containing protein [Candidatus Dependentiae bacterium]
MHKPIHIKNLTLSFPHKLCFDNVTASILPGSRIALIGKNGSGKSTFLAMLAGLIIPTEGTITMPEGIRSGYVPQISEKKSTLSGGQQFNKALTQALALDPTLLLLDEPTNHLDTSNRRSLIRMLQSYTGTLIVASHDTSLVRATVSSLWHIDNGRILQFSGSYDNYERQRETQRTSLERNLSQLTAQKEETHSRLMEEQARAKKSRSYGQKQKNNSRWSTMVASSKARQAEKTAGSRSHAIAHEKQELIDTLTSLRPPEILIPRFSLRSSAHTDKMIVSVTNGCIGYKDPLIEDINFSLMRFERVGITGANGSGKSTFIKALLANDTIIRKGTWHSPHASDIGYLDQNYATLPYDTTVLNALKELIPTWSDVEARAHLNSFLFRKNEEVDAQIYTLSGGERARLSLAFIAARPPKLLILDEISNNLDRETIDHVIAILQQFTGAMIIVSHDEELIHALGLTKHYTITKGILALSA